jgi:outer membrane protein assembly factor BamB
MVSVRNLTRCFGWSIVPVVLFTSCIQPTYSPPEEAKELLQLWRYDHDLIADPLILNLNDTLFNSGGQDLFAIDANSGDEFWKVQAVDSFSLGGRVFISSGSQLVNNQRKRTIAWDKKTGTFLWETIYNDRYDEPRLTGNHSSTPNGYAIATNSNRVLILDKYGNVTYTKKLDRRFRISGVSYYQNRIYVNQSNTVHGALEEGRITVFDLQTGDSLWAYDTQNDGFFEQPVFEDGVLFAGTRGNSELSEVIALDANSGNLIWKKVSKVWTYTITMSEKYLYINTYASINAIDKESGDLIWSVGNMHSAACTPVILGGYVYNSTYGSVRIIDENTGEIVHREPTKGGSIWGLTTSSDKVYFQTSWAIFAYQAWHLRKDL